MAAKSEQLTHRATNASFTFRDLVGAAPCTLFPRLEFCRPWLRPESVHPFYRLRGRRPSKKNPASRCHRGRRPPEVLLAQWMRPSCCRAGGHRWPLTSWLQDTAGLFPSLRRNGSVGCRWSQRPLWAVWPRLDLQQQPSARHSHQRNEPSRGRHSGLLSLSGRGEGPLSDTCHNLTPQNTLPCTVLFSEFKISMCQTLLRLYRYIFNSIQIWYHIKSFERGQIRT